MGVGKSFKYAFRGFIYCILNERNMRIHTVVSLYVLFFAYLFRFTKQEYSLLLLTMSSVITAEMVNTSIEKLSDFCTCEYSQVICVVKNIAAGAVACCAMFSAVVGVVLFSNAEKILKIINLFFSDPCMMGCLVVSVAVAILYIFIGPVKIFLRLKKTVGGKRVGR